MGIGYISFTIGKGLIVPMTMQGAQGQAAELSIDIYPISSDGVTEPIIVGTTTALMGVHGDAYIIGDLTISSVITGIQDINLNFGYNVATNAGENGKPYPTLAYIDKQEAGLTVKTASLSAATQARINTGASTADVSFSFRKLAEGGVPSGTLTGTFKKALVHAEGISGGRPSTISIVTTPVYGGSGNDYLTWAAA
jgi:hypothetical protein